MISFHRSPLVAAVLIASASVISSAAAAPQPAPAAQVGAAVHIANFTFSPAILSVKAGTTVTWTNDDDIPHTVVAIDKSFRSKVLDTGERFSFTFAKPGQFGYFCSLHPHMTGKVVVRA
jgi:plastocyanin